MFCVNAINIVIDGSTIYLIDLTHLSLSLSISAHFIPLGVNDAFNP